MLLTSCDLGTDCGFLKSAEVRARVDEIATTSTVLVADCKGRYSPYDAHHTPQTDKTVSRDSVLVDDRILR